MARHESRPVQPRVLLVENSANERHSCRKALQQVEAFDIDLVEVEDGESGLTLANREKFDCILLDYRLPDMNSLEFLERLAEPAGRWQLPVLKLVEPSKPELAVEAIKRGAHDYLIKDAEGHYLKLLPFLIQRLLESQRISHEKHQIETMYRTLVDHIPAITYIASPHSGNPLLYVSPQIDALGYGRDVWLSSRDIRLKCIHEDDRQQVGQALAESCENGELFRCEYRMLSRDGNLHWFIDEARVIKGCNGRAMFFQGVMLDITDMKNMENELHGHRYFLEQQVRIRTEQLERRIMILESCNSELCNQLQKEYAAYKQLREINRLQENMLQTFESAILPDAVIS